MASIMRQSSRELDNDRVAVSGNNSGIKKFLDYGIRQISESQFATLAVAAKSLVAAVVAEVRHRENEVMTFTMTTVL
jgi:hypothetical protein